MNPVDVLLWMAVILAGGVLVFLLYCLALFALEITKRWRIDNTAQTMFPTGANHRPPVPPRNPYEVHFPE